MSQDPSDKVYNLLLAQITTLSGQVAAAVTQLSQNTALVGKLEERINNVVSGFERRSKDECPAPGKCLELQEELKQFVRDVASAREAHERRIRVLEDERSERAGAAKKQLQLIGLVGMASGLLGALASPVFRGLVGMAQPAGHVQKVNGTK